MEKEKKENCFWGNFKKELQKKEVIIAVVIAIIIGLIIGLAVMFFIKSIIGNVVTFAGKGISEQELYSKMKKHYSIDLVLEQIDKTILDKKYSLTETMKEEVSKNTDSFLEQYETYYGYTEEEIYESFGFKGREELEEYMTLSYKRMLYVYDYLEGKLEAGAVNKYYEENKESLAKYDSKHILVKISDEVTDEVALATSKEIITKLNEGKTYDDIVAEYGDKVVAEKLGFYGANDGLETSYFEALAALEDNSYSKEPVKTSYGYHVIFRLKTATFDDIRKDIIDILAEDIKTEDSNYAYNALIIMREEANIKFKDIDLKAKYEEYCKTIEEKEE